MSEPLWERRLRIVAAHVNPADRSVTFKVEGIRENIFDMEKVDTLYVFTEEEVDRFQNDYNDLWAKFRKARENELRFRRHFKELKILMEEEE